jgi:DNA polymerase
MSKQDKLDALQSQIETELVCPLKDAATHVVFGKGNPNAQILFIGEAPGEQEDLQGIPFVGRAGKELDKLLRIIGLTLEDVYIANILKYRPPKNRDPTKEEMIAHTPYLVRQIEIIQPKVLVPLGNFATKFVLNNFSPIGMTKIEGISKLHGKSAQVGAFQVFPLYHPAAMLYNPKLREILATDMWSLGTFLRSTAK